MKLNRTQKPNFELSVEGIKAFVVSGVIKTSRRGYKSGLTDKYYVDFDNLTSDPSIAKNAVDQYVKKLDDISKYGKIDYLAFLQKNTGTAGALKLSGALSIVSEIPTILIRPSKEISFDKIKVPSQPTNKRNEQLLGSNVVIITDHTTTGGEIIDAVNIIENNGGKVTGAITYTVRTDRFIPEPFDTKKIGFHYIYQIPKQFLSETIMKIEMSN